LGDTLQLIAGEKAGIIKPNTPIVIGEYQPEVAEIFIAKAKKENAPLMFASEEWSEEVKNQKSKIKSLKVAIRNKNSQLTTHNLQLDLSGSYQTKNLKTVLRAITELTSQGFNVTSQHISDALKQVKNLTGLRGRWDILSHNPLVICDTGHNPDGIAEVLKNIANIPFKQLHFVMGMVNDKDHSKVLAMLPKDAIYYFCRPDIPRGLDAESLKQKAESFDLHGLAYADVANAFAAAKQAADNYDLVFVGGSTFVVAEVV